MNKRAAEIKENKVHREKRANILIYIDIEHIIVIFLIYQNLEFYFYKE